MTATEITTTDSPQALLPAILQLARDPAVDVAKLQALLDMQVGAETRQAEINFYQALSRIPPIRVPKNGRITLAKKDGTTFKPVPFARWEDMSLVLDPLLAAEGFRLMFDSAPRPGDGGGLIVTGTLVHRDGHSKSASIPLPLDTGPGRNNLQAMGSTLSYGRRYVAEMLLNITREGVDDDGASYGSVRISEQEADEVFRLIQETKSDQVKFLEFMQVNSIADITVDQLPRALNLLHAKAKRMAAP